MNYAAFFGLYELINIVFPTGRDICRLLYYIFTVSAL